MFFEEFLNAMGAAMSEGSENLQTSGVFGGDPMTQPQQPTTVPPASAALLRSLPMVKVTADDLLEENNKECLICLEDHQLGTLACKIPCGHLFHRNCVSEWLQKHCTCPVCRYELETDDPHYERERKSRMKKRKMRYRLDELTGKSIGQLKVLCSTLGVNISDCIDKQEVIERLVQSGFIGITEGSPPIEMRRDEFESKKVSELRHLLLSFGLTEDGAVDKSELRSKLVESGRIILTDETTNQNADKADELHQEHIIQDDPPEEPPSPVRRKPRLDFPVYFLHELQEMSISSLRQICRSNNIDISGCIDKTEVVEKVLYSGKIRLRKPPKLVTQTELDSASTKELRVMYTESGLDDPYIGTLDSFSLKSKLLETQVVRIVDSTSSKLSNSNCAEPTIPSSYSSNGVFESKPSSYAASFSTSSSFSSNSLSNNNNPTAASFASSSSSSSSNTESTMNHDNDLVLCKDLINEMSIKEIKEIMKAYQISFDGCVEKHDMIHRVAASGKVKIID